MQQRNGHLMKCPDLQSLARSESHAPHAPDVMVLIAGGRRCGPPLSIPATEWLDMAIRMDAFLEVVMVQAPLQLVDSDEAWTAVIHLTVPRNEIEMGPAIHEVVSVLARQGVTPCGPLFSWHRRRPSDTFDFEVGFPVSQMITASGRVTMSTLPAARVARSVYRGDYSGLGDGWGALIAAVTEAGLPMQGGLWERYLSGPESAADPASWCTELNLVLMP